MIIWLTLDSAWTYLVDGVYGCRLWVSEPVLNPDTGWSSPEQEHSVKTPGKRFFKYRSDIDEIDMSIMWHIMPEIDMQEDRYERFGLIREHIRRSPEIHRCSWKFPIHVAPHVWFQIALDTAGAGGVWEAAHFQKTFDLPF